jgi:WhiB family transcriptional regulator, redox-sensing transcriptional regulator
VSVETFVRLAQLQPWMEHGLCKGSGASFFPSETRTKRVSAERYAEAVKVCQACPVIEPCREYGKDERYGVWGGTTPNERSPRVSVVKPAACGTWQGYYAHQRRSFTDACQACKDAYNRYRQERKWSA